MTVRLIEEGPHKGEPAITKAEILFTRRCPLRCAGCAIYRIDEHGTSDTKQSDLEEASMDKWFATVDNLKELGCGFMAIYGAEPAQVPKRVASFIHYVEVVSGIPCSVITSGVGLTNDMIDLWWGSGLRSLTMSVDGLAGEGEQTSSISSKKKTDKAWHYLSYFVDKYGKEMRDAEGCMTITRRNVEVIPELIKVMSEKRIWWHGDIVHWNRGQDYSKVETELDLDGLTFKTPEDIAVLQRVIEEIISMKDGGYLIHPGKESLKAMVSMGPKLEWQCCQGSSGFIGMVTVDVNCVIRPCDDFLPAEMDVSRHNLTASPERRGFSTRRDGKKAVRKLSLITPNMIEGVPIFGWELSKRWDEYKKRTKEQVEKHNCRCMWATHMSAQNIYEGVGEDLEHYIHRRVSDL